MKLKQRVIIEPRNGGWRDHISWMGLLHHCRRPHPVATNDQFFICSYGRYGIGLSDLPALGSYVQQVMYSNAENTRGQGLKRCPIINHALIL